MGPAGAPRTLIKGRRFPATAPQVYKAARLVLADVGWQIFDVAAGERPDEASQRGEADLPSDVTDDGQAADLGVSGTIDVPVPTARSTAEAAEAADPFARPESERYLISAVASDIVLALPSDVTIRIAEDDGETLVDLTSVSRLVAWDLGQNRRFAESFLDRLDAAMRGVAAAVPAQQ